MLQRTNSNMGATAASSSQTNSNMGATAASLASPVAVIQPSDVQVSQQFNTFLDSILRVYTIDEPIKMQIKETMQKLNIPDKIKFMTDSRLQEQLIAIDTTIQREYDKVKQYINDGVWIDFLKNIIQLQVMVFLRKIPLDAIIRPFEEALNKKIDALVSTKRESDTKEIKSKYMRYKKKYLALK